MKKPFILDSSKLKVYFQQKPPRQVRWGFHASAFDPLMIGLTEDGLLCRVEFARGRKPAVILEKWQKLWPKTEFYKDKDATAAIARQMTARRKSPPLLMTGTQFQQDVWRVLMQIPTGQVISYAEVAKRIKRPRAVRAVGTACGANPVPVLVPCHRVVGSHGKLGGFGGGLQLKVRMLRTEGIH